MRLFPERHDYTQPIPPEYEAAISSRQRRALRGPSRNERLQTARTAQRDSGVRVRIARSVADQRVFGDQLAAWHPPVQNRVAKRKSLGNFAMTIFDTNQQPLRYPPDHTEESLVDLFDRRMPALLQPIGPIRVTGIRPLGSAERPFIALMLDKQDLGDEIPSVRGLVAPELWLDDSHQLEFQPHVSLGQLHVRRLVPAMIAELESVVPDRLVFAPANITVDQI